MVTIVNKFQLHDLFHKMAAKMYM